ncbi:MAG: fatty acid--CoA ligase [Candidatus Velthaea sp.]
MSAYDFPLLIKQLLLAPLAHRSTTEIVYRGRRFGYPMLRERIGRLGSTLCGLGVQRGDTVAVMDWDSHRYLECYFAIPMIGAVLETVNVRFSKEQLIYCLNHAEASVLICNLEFLPIIDAIRSELTGISKIIWASDSGPLPAGLAGEGEYEDVIARGDPAHPFPDFDENTRATIFYTTGTTGLPKGVTFTHRQLVLHTLATSATLGIKRETVYMPMTPMFHVHAWGLPYVATLAGCKQVYPGRYLPDALLGLIRDERVTFTHCVPTILQMLLAAPGSEKIDLNGLRMIVGGSALPRALCEAALARGIDAFTGYGMSETCPLLAVAALHPQTPRDLEHEIQTRMKAGHSLPLVDLRIVDFDMNDVAHDGIATGEIVARAPWLTQVYYKNPAATDVLWGGGFLHTQDIGTIDSEGNVQITDRLKDLIKTGGEWVSSLELESIIGNDPDVAEVAVIGLPDPKWGERPAAVVVARAGVTLHAADIKARVMRLADVGVVPKYAVPAHVFFLAELPKTSVGKLDKKVLRQVFSSVSFVEAV